MTVRNARNGTANIDTGLQAPGPAFVTIAHVSLSGSQRGLDVLNRGAGSSGEMIEADIIDNDFFDNYFRENPNQGVRVVNFQVVGSVINARIAGNRSWGQPVGMTLANNNATNSVVHVNSSGNRFFDNGAGAVVLGGNGAANGNIVNLEARGDQFLDNAAQNVLVGGLRIIGGETSIGNGVNNNTVNVALWGCRLEGNNTWDIYGVGAHSTPESIGTPGANNHVTIEIHGEGNGRGRWQPVEFFADTVPSDPATTNSVTVIR
jgi:hypothetical protein